tara:strand:+ start:949 stop:1071 length:123 start_codon:yes stop_codon:yes gene_type:complete
MNKRRSKIKYINSILFLIIGFVLGVGAVWPSLVTNSGRNI